jgi:hypothetical protein
LSGTQITWELFPEQCGQSIKRADIETILEPKSLNFLEKIGDWFVMHLVVKNLVSILHTLNIVILNTYYFTSLDLKLLVEAYKTQI